MKLVFIGHQSWMLSFKETNILLDPVLHNRFGHCGSDLRVFPPRDVDISKMPKVDAIFLSHEHLDHFHIPSLNSLDKCIPFYVGPLMPSCVTKTITALGFSVRSTILNETLAIKDLEVICFNAASKTVFWEKRVTQYFVRPLKSQGKAIFVAVDALLSDDYQEMIAREELEQPKVLILSNNAQIPPPKATGAYTNLLPLPETERVQGKYPGLSVLHSLFLKYAEELPEAEYTVLCGGGWVDGSELFGPFLFSDNKELADIANKLTLSQRAFGPYPGDEIEFSTDGPKLTKSNWIKLDTKQFAKDLLQHKNYLDHPREKPFQPLTGEFENSDQIRAALIMLKEEIVHMARAMMLSKVGQLALATNTYLQGPLGPKRILLSFYEGKNQPIYRYALDLNEGRFIAVDTPGEVVMTTYPFGLDVHLKDFSEMLSGRIQIWDLAGNGMRSWFLGSIYENVLVFFLEYYGEQVRGDLAWSIYKREIERLGLDIHV